MRLGIMQPYFFPYPGHFSLIASVDRWVVFDTSQYTARSWMTRNRVLHPQQGWQYVSVPLANGSTGIRTREAALLHPSATRTAILGKLSHYRRHAPHYGTAASLVAEAFDKADTLVDLNVQALRAVCRVLGLGFDCAVLSDLKLSLPERLGPGDWALEICSALGATSYVNPASGRALFDPAAFRARGIELLFATAADVPYQPRGRPYQPGLSILDVLMWLPPDQAAAAIRAAVQLAP